MAADDTSQAQLQLVCHGFWIPKRKPLVYWYWYVRRFLLLLRLMFQHITDTYVGTVLKAFERPQAVQGLRL